MRKHLVGTLVAAAVALAACAAPAFTADSGTLTVSITAQAPAAPCLTVTPGNVYFDTRPFSISSAISVGAKTITVNNCGTVSQNLLGSATDATGPGGSWTPRAFGPNPNPCAALNQFYLSIIAFGGPGTYLYMTGTAAPVLVSDTGPPAVFPVGDKEFLMQFTMPCQGSNGAGETKTLSVTLTATVA
jgi:type 1 fimbria pilin